MTLATTLERIASGDAPLGGDVPLDYPQRTPLVTAGKLRRRRAWSGGEAEVAVRPGDRVAAADVVAHALLPARASAVDVVGLLGVTTDRVPASMARRVGEMVAEGDVLAERRSLGGLQRRTLRSPVAGRLSFVSTETGIAYVEPAAVEQNVVAHLAGEVVGVTPSAVVIEGEGLAIGGLAGAGPAVSGILFVADSPDDLPAQAEGTILACGFVLDEATLERINALGVGAVIATAVEEEAIARLGWDDLLWPQANRGAPRPAPPLTIILLAPGGTHAASGIWDLLRGLAGRAVSAIGGEPNAVPELLIFVPEAEAEEAVRRHFPGETRGAADDEVASGALAVGRRVRVQAGRAEGLAGEVEALGATPFRLASEVRADVAEVAFPYDVHLRVPLLHLRAVR
jgi:hypothetical protein